MLLVLFNKSGRRLLRDLSSPSNLDIIVTI